MVKKEYAETIHGYQPMLNCLIWLRCRPNHSNGSWKRAWKICLMNYPHQRPRRRWKFELYFTDYEFDEPKYTIAEAKMHNANYSRALKVTVSLENKETGEVKEDKVLWWISGHDTWGTFIINGSERVVVSQIIRSSGVFFSKTKIRNPGKSVSADKSSLRAELWIEFEMRSSDVWYAKLDRSKKIPLTSFIRALGVAKTKKSLSCFWRKRTDVAISDQHLLQRPNLWSRWRG